MRRLLYSFRARWSEQFDDHGVSAALDWAVILYAAFFVLAAVAALGHPR